MKKTLSIIALLTAVLLFSACSGNSQNQTDFNLNAVGFAEKLNEMPAAPLIDVRTSGEFENGHLNKAQNIDWNGNHFEEAISKYNKEDAIFVYCLSGGRSHSAAERMRSMGFKKVFELDGGIMKWRAANLPEENTNNSGMSVVEFEQLLNTNKKVLIDFYADWCGPCKKMAPYLEAMKTEMADSLAVVRINTDTNQQIAKNLKVDALPTLLLFKNGKQIWNHKGFIEKSDLIKTIQSNR